MNVFVKFSGTVIKILNAIGSLLNISVVSLDTMEDFEKTFKGKESEDGTVETWLEPIRISLVAPSGFGKSTLISTIIVEIQKKLKHPENGTLEVVPQDAKNKERLHDIDEAINNAIANHKILTNLKTTGTGGVGEYTFDIILTSNDGKNKIIQPFSMMDIPGGWINEKVRASAGAKAESDWKEFLDHLAKSKILWLPIDATMLCESITEKDVRYATDAIDITDINELALAWSQYRKESEKPAVCYIPVKCESYTNNKVKENELREKVLEKYKLIKDTVQENSPFVEQYYVPVETIGCIELDEAKWEGADLWNAKYSITGDARKITNADKLLKKIYEYAYIQITEKPEKAEKVVKELQQKLSKMSLWDKLGKNSEIQQMKTDLDDNQCDIVNIKEILRPLVLEFGKVSQVSLDRL